KYSGRPYITTCVCVCVCVLMLLTAQYVLLLEFELIFVCASSGYEFELIFVARNFSSHALMVFPSEN
ncbi:hypothetical protein L9F63_017677, partial [Diploptera punctata]